jgi:hypothetical protein
VFVFFEPARGVLLFGLLGFGGNDWKLTASLAVGSHHSTAQCY